MRRLLFMTGAGAVLASAAWIGSVRGVELGATAPGSTTPAAVKPLPPAKPAPESSSCGNNGTTVHFVDTPSIAARQAKKEHKLVFILHVSGLFEDPRLT